MSRMGYSPTGISGFGNAVVYGMRRVPLPPARTTTGVCSQSIVMGDGLFIGFVALADSKYWRGTVNSGEFLTRAFPRHVGKSSILQLDDFHFAFADGSPTFNLRPGKGKSSTIVCRVL